MTEQWRDIPGFDGRYEVSDAGQVRAKPRLQRFVSKRGNEAFRRTAPRIVSQQKINSGYLIVHLSHQYDRKALTVHRIVAAAFCPGAADELDVNHKNGVKTDNRAENLEWLTRSKNHLHAVSAGLWSNAIEVVDPLTMEKYPSIAQAAQATGVDPHRISREWRALA